MTKTDSKKSKSKKFIKQAGLIALIAGGMVGGFTCGRYVKSDEFRIKKEISTMSVDQIRDAIKTCDTALADLQKTIDSDETGAEDRFQARQAYDNISYGRELLQKRLDKINSGRGKTIDIRDVSKTR